MLKSYILYDNNHKVIPMSLLRLRKPPQTNLTVVEVTSNICCTPPDEVTQGSEMMAFLGLDSRGNVISGPIVRKHRPKTGKWMQIKYDLCCDSSVPCEDEIPEIDPLEDSPVLVQIGGITILETEVYNLGDTGTIQWYFKGMPLTDGDFEGTIFGGTENGTLYIDYIQAQFFGQYTITASNCAGSTSVNIIVGEQVPTVTITQQPQDQEFAEEVTFSVEATSTEGEISYIWAYYNTDEGVFYNITAESWLWPEISFSGEGTDTLTLTNVTEDLIGVQILVYAYDGVTEVKSNIVTII